MKAIVCEMCSGHDFVKDGDFFVCQSCGTKYSADDAKKMMIEIEGTVDVSGSSVKIDQSEELEKLYALARRAKENNDSENGAKYYAMILEKKPDDWEAAFYSMLYRNKNIKVGEIINADSRYCNAISPILELIKTTVTDKTEQIRGVNEITNETIKFRDVLHANDQYYSGSGLLNCVGDAVKRIFEDEDCFIEYVLTLWKKSVEANTNSWYSHFHKSVDFSTNWGREIDRTVKKIKEIDNSYQMPVYDRQKYGSGCYVATCVYGSYDCPQVWTLRRFRDNTLAATWYGRAFIRTYYAVSPTLVRWFGETKWFRTMWKKPLDRMVTRLKRKGVADTPYQDTQW